ncbi:MAG TPA: VOC family protein [Verrucomicrobiae bacterium]|nr:VOC family protein [Verrucomicrobiae bacterium]
MAESAASTSKVDTKTDASRVHSVVSMIHVSNVDRSAAFYRLLGFEIGNFVPREGEKSWAWLYSPGAADWKIGPNLMLARTSRPLNPGAQDVLFYLYAKDLNAVRSRLIAEGFKPGEIEHPEYLPNGEFGVQDPDGYCLMIAQAAEDTP